MLRDFLDRFRPAGTPGAASGAGIPADRRADAEEELAPVFAALADAERRCTETRDRAERQAVRQTAQSQRMSAAIVTRARSQAGARRAAAAAEGQAADFRNAARRLMPALVDRIVARAEELAESVVAEPR